MCGRFTLISPPEVVAELFDLPEVPELAPRYNIAPTQAVAAVLVDGPDSPRCLRGLRWGLVPSWADDPSLGNRMINARAESVAQKPAFRQSFLKRRCLVAADGFYEWQKVGNGKKPFYMRMADGAPFALAGLWAHWEGADGQTIDSCALITTAPNDLVKPIHDRMPVILAPHHYDLWLDPKTTQADRLQPMLAPYPAQQMTAFPVSTLVNNPANDLPRCVDPAGRS